MRQTHVLPMGYFLWIFGFLGMHRFYYNSKKLGCLYLFTLGGLGIGWLIDLFLLPKIHQKFQASAPAPGEANYTLTWLLFVFLGLFGVHKLYLQKKGAFFLYFMTFAFLGIGLIVDLFRLNQQIEIFNLQASK